ncbi:RidA family protein [Deinococcus navajonensis]|uniref:RidA family protein n=1 Tax=Deinococcus navajonensis TaxID=309884 RepID=A0ABV8XHZ2_9DEIO
MNNAPLPRHQSLRVTLDAEQAAAGHDLGRQTRIVLGRLNLQLQALERTMADVLCLTFLVTDIGHMGEAYELLDPLADTGAFPPGSAVVVPALSYAGALVEIEAVIALPG